MEQQKEPLDHLRDVDTNLRSTNELIGYKVVSRNEEIGKIEDFVIDHNLWVLRYTIIATGTIFSGKKLIIASHWASDISWDSKQVTFDIDVNVSKNGPTFENKTDITQDFERRLFDFYRKPYYWKQ